MSKKQALVICPGRGTYNKPELGYLTRHHSHRSEMLDIFEQERKTRSQPSLKSLDGAERYSVATHTRGDNASLLIHACAIGDFNAIDRNRYDIAAITGNSMGWYIALACAGAVNQVDGANIVNTMGAYMQETMIGRQIVYPLVDDDWKAIPERRAEVLTLMDRVNAQPDLEIHISIELGGMIVLAGNDAGLKAMTDLLPVIDRFPMSLANHAGFHTSLQLPISERALSTLPKTMMTQPTIPMIDGRGTIWQPASVDHLALHQYTLGQQVTDTYNFTRAVQVGVREFAPDCIIILGPGNTLGGAVAQSLIDISWQSLESKAGFAERQATDPYILAMGRDDQRALVTG
ncbi:MAG: ACP S-malonyltransferase [Hyphomonadaceae bacterium]